MKDEEMILISLNNVLKNISDNLDDSKEEEWGSRWYDYFVSADKNGISQRSSCQAVFSPMKEAVWRFLRIIDDGALLKWREHDVRTNRYICSEQAKNKGINLLASFIDITANDLLADNSIYFELQEVKEQLSKENLSHSLEEYVPIYGLGTMEKYLLEAGYRGVKARNIRNLHQAVMSKTGITYIAFPGKHKGRKTQATSSKSSLNAMMSVYQEMMSENKVLKKNKEK